MNKDREIAYHVLEKIEKSKAYSNLELNSRIRKDGADSPAFVREIVYGVTRNKYYLDYILKQFVQKGFDVMKPSLKTILRMGLYQMKFMGSVPEYAAINETVDLAKEYCRGKSGFVNGVLRNVKRAGEDTFKVPRSEKNLVDSLSTRYSFSPWIVRLWIDQLGEEDAEELMKAANETPELCILVNRTKNSRDELAERLEQEGFKIGTTEESDRALFVKGTGLLGTEAFREGCFTVQDLSSIMAVEALAPGEEEVIIDVCAAPGGKTISAAEFADGKGRHYAFDLYENKLKPLSVEAERMGFTGISIEQRDAQSHNKGLEGRADCVICDVPCSGLGVIRRKPEIKYKELSDDGRGLARIQMKILESSVNYLRHGGRLMYSTCTINKIENEDVVYGFIKKHRGFKIREMDQFFIGEDNTDGFFYCILERE